jgi:hypothetical protein
MGGTERVAEDAGDSASLSFTGSMMTLVYRQDVDRGIATIRIDGAVVGQLDQYGPVQAQRSVTYTSTAGAHTIQILVNRAKQAASSGYSVGVDAFIAASGQPMASPTPTTVPGPTATADDASGLITFAGSWLSQADASARGGTERMSEVAGDTASLTFTGSSVQLVYRQDMNRGVATVRIDGVTVEQLDQYGLTQAQRTVVYPVSSGTHTIQIVVNRTRQPLSTGYAVGVDAFVVAGTVVPPPTATPVAPTATATPRVPAPTATATPRAPAPTATPTRRNGRPAVKVTNSVTTDGRLAVRVSTSRTTTRSDATEVETDNVTDCGGITAIEFPSNASATSNVRIDFPDGPSGLRTGQTFQAASEQDEVRFYVRRIGPGAVTVPLVVHDGCGEWRSFVGGGATSF